MLEHVGTTKQATFFEVYDDKLNGFDEFWALFPRDKMRPGRKSGKTRCRHLWKKKKLYLQIERVMSALQEDLKAIDKGTYQMAVNSTDKLHYFPGIQPWLNQDKWDRDPVEAPLTDSKPQVGVTPANLEEPPQMNMTAQEKAAMLPIWGLVARRKASLWPRKLRSAF